VVKVDPIQITIGRFYGGLTGIRRVVERVAGHQSAAVQSTRQHELYLGRPLLDGVRFRLSSLVVLFEIVREVAVQVETARVVPALAAVALTLAGHFETVRIHRRQNVNASVVQKPADVRVHRIAVHQVLYTQTDAKRFFFFNLGIQYTYRPITLKKIRSVFLKTVFIEI